MSKDEHVSTKLLLEEIVKNRNEIKNYIDALEARQQIKIEELKKKVENLEEENRQLKNELEITRRIEKKNSIVIFGWVKNNEILTCEDLCAQINKLLNIKLSKDEISNYYFLGKKENSPIKVEFARHLVKKLVLDNRKQLKGQNISINNDLTPQQQNEYKLLRKHLLLAKQEGQKNCYIKNGKLFVDEETYDYEDLLQLEKTDVVITSNSTPSTPTLVLNNQENLIHDPKSVPKSQVTPKTTSNNTKVINTRFQNKQRNNSTSKTK